MSHYTWRIAILAAAIGAVCASSIASAETLRLRTIAPIVSTDWLADNGNSARLAVLDVRLAEDYQVGHIPGAVNAPFEVPFSAWITMRDDLLLEVPDTVDLFAAIGALGITPVSRVVIVSDPNPGEPPFYGLSAAARVADTLIYAGVRNVAILDGGYSKWQAEGLPVTTEAPSVVPTVFDGHIDEEMFVSTAEVRSSLRSAAIIDARDADVYYGATIEPFAEKAGHIPTASSLPAPWIWDSNDDAVYTYKDAELLGNMASGVLNAPGCDKRQGRHLCKEIVVYCGVGGYASAWWYILSEVLGYRNVRFYDGSAQEWARYYEMVPFQWN